MVEHSERSLSLPKGAARSSGIIFYINLLFRNASPEEDLRYFSKSVALF